MAKGCMAQGCRARDCKEPAVHMKAAQQAEVASSRLAAAGCIEVAVAGTEVPGHTAAAVAARAIGSHHLEGTVTECFADGAAAKARDTASSKLAVVARARHRHHQQPNVLREACCRIELADLAQWSGEVCDKVVEGWSVQKV